MLFDVLCDRVAFISLLHCLGLCSCLRGLLHVKLFHMFEVFAEHADIQNAQHYGFVTRDAIRMTFNTVIEVGTTLLRTYPIQLANEVSSAANGLAYPGS